MSGLVKKKRRSRRKWQNAKCCHWCGCALNTIPGHPHQRTRDHLIPRSKGGKGHHNLVAACRACNEKRGASADWRSCGARRKTRMPAVAEAEAEAQNRISAEGGQQWHHEPNPSTLRSP